MGALRSGEGVGFLFADSAEIGSLQTDLSRSWSAGCSAEAHPKWPIFNFLFLHIELKNFFKYSISSLRILDES